MVNVKLYNIDDVKFIDYINTRVWKSLNFRYHQGQILNGE